MPLVRITVRDDTSAESQRAISDGVHRAMLATIGIPEADHFQIIDRRPADSIIADPGYLLDDGERRNVVFVEITLVAGRSQEKKRALFAAVATELGQVGVRPEDVFVVLRETQREDWSMGNGESQILDPELLKRHGWTPPTK